MAVESHIHSLKVRHEELESQIKEMTANTATDEAKITDLKRRKLLIKDRIRELSTSSLN